MKNKTCQIARQENPLFLGMILIVMLASSLTAVAQSPRDTINGRSRDSTYYYYDYHPDTCRTDVANWPMYSYWAQFFYSDSVLPIKGVAVSTTIAPITDYTPSELTSIRVGISKHQTDDQWVELASDTLDLLDTARMMYVDYNTYQVGDTVRRTNYTPIYEIFFDKSIEVQDSFYAFVHSPTNGHYSPNFGDVQLAAFYRLRSCKPSTWRPHSAIYFTMYNEWQYNNLGYHALILYPIVDTAALNAIPPCDTMTCDRPTGLRVERQEATLADLVWTGAPLHGQWEVSYGLMGTAPGLGEIIPTTTTTATIDGLDSHMHYTAYVRGYCSECHKWSEWSDGVELFVGMFDPEDTTGNHHDTIGIAMVEQLSRVVPNPARERVQVMSSFGLRQVDIYDMQGKLERSARVTGYSTELDIRGFAKGLHLVNIFTPAGVVTKRLVVE